LSVIRSGFTRLLVIVVLTLVFFAGVDALRSSLSDEDGQQTVAQTDTIVAAKSFPACRPEQLEAAIEVRGGIANNVLRWVSGPACHQHGLSLELTILDGAGKRAWHGQDFATEFARNYAQSPRMLVVVSEQTVHFVTPNSDIRHCHRRGPFAAIARIGPYVARAGGLSASEIGCV
jgi:hypothetical protein